MMSNIFNFELPKFPLDKITLAILDFLTEALAGVTKIASNFIETGVEGLGEGIIAVPTLVVIAVITFVVWKFIGRNLGIFALIGLLVTWNLQLWDATIYTIVLVLLSTILALIVGIPLGIWAALDDRVNKVITPILDFMQTMPPFVYLIPMIPFFGLGTVAAAFATMIFAVPPAIRLTNLGIRQIDKELIEASESFGTTPAQKLLKVQLPLAKPTIMAGINQTIMLALSMVVIAAMIGAGGLGGKVLAALTRFRPGEAFEAGLGVVIVAMLLDRITQNVAGRRRKSPAETE
ncbi:MAG: ABC transporter permease subunit [Spirochaetales bacterium]|nr:ABC transporter permease subunit [Spirochaetales bacterium]MCF7937010.1 ABC transporter permease subunit [Spirochaetales bacterium]